MKFGQNLRIGLLGASKIAPEAIIKPAQAIPRVQVTSMAAREVARGEAYAKAHQIPNCYPGYAQLVAADDVDLVYCALPVSHHAAWCIKALEAGKHVLCEKPFAMNLAEATRMVDAAHANGVRIVEAFHYSHHPAFRLCKSWVQAGLIGQISQLNGVFSTQIPIDGVEIRSVAQLGGGAMMDLGCYPLHWVESLVGSPALSVEAQGVLTTTGVDQQLAATLHFEGGATAEISTDMGPEAALEASLRLVGELGVIQFTNPLAPHFGASLTAELNDGSVQRAAITSLSTYAYQLAEVADAILSNQPLENEGGRILQQQASLDAVYNAAGFGHLRTLVQG